MKSGAARIRKSEKNRHTRMHAHLSITPTVRSSARLHVLVCRHAPCAPVKR
ncbi:hypothetical protein BaRGS_00033236, partial [Batillaria attramentaria]